MEEILEVKSVEIKKEIQPNTVVKKERQTGFEILRILAMLLICAVHVMNAGGMLSHAEGGGALLWQRLLYSIFLISVNVFVLISGYFMVKSKFKVKKLFQLWLEVLFFSILTYILYCAVAGGTFQFGEFITYFLPVITQKYWFFSAYILLYLISPFLNKILNNSTKKELSILVVGMLIFVYLATRFNFHEVSAIATGYNMFWFIILYLFGGYSRLYPLKIKKWIIFIVYLVCTLSVWGMSYMPNTNFWTNLIYNSFDYTSPLVLISSICALLLFKDIKIKNKFIHTSICFISSCTFGVYLFHTSPIEIYLFFDILHMQNHWGSPYSALWVILFALAIFAIGFVVDCIRKLLVWLIKLIYKKIKSKNQNSSIKQNEQNLPESEEAKVKN